MQDVPISEYKKEYEIAKKWLEDKPEIDRIEVAIGDINGVFRGKSVPISKIESIYMRKMRMPLSILYLDIWGDDVTRLSYASGDLDGICVPTSIGLIPKAWSKNPSALLMVTLTNDDGLYTGYDPRNALLSVIQQYEKLNLSPVIAFELEFYLTDPSKPFASPVLVKDNNEAMQFPNSFSIDELEIFDSFLDDIIEAAEKMNIPTENLLSECGCGQFEVNLVHRDNAVRAADDAVLLRQIIRGIARKHGFRATFMSKPYLEESGSGMHMHYSLVDNNGQNVFDDGTEQGSDILRNAIGGICDTMPECTLFSIPNINSFRRIRDGELSPNNVSWGYDNRTTTLRIPGGSPKSRRIEFRLPGSDANPYLIAATTLGSALYGINNKRKPPKPTTGNAYMTNSTELPDDWPTAIESLERGILLKDIIDPDLIKVFLSCKNQEYDVFSKKMSKFEYRTYLGTF